VKPIRILLLLALCLAMLPPSAARADSHLPTLTVYTYGSFVSEWGPGPGIQAAFEAECSCKLEWVALDDAALLLTRLRLEGERSRADIVLGLDTSLLAEAKATGLFASHGVPVTALDMPVDWTDEIFLPFDYGHFAFVYDSERIDVPPTSLQELVEQGGPKVIVQDPRSSTPGLGLLLWMKRIYGDDAEAAWSRFSNRILTVTKGWSEAYGLFLEGEAPMVLSYATSPAYHVMAEGDDRYRAASFAEGHYPQIEIVGRLRTSQHPELARQFLAFVLEPGFQRHIPTNNIMWPVIDLGADLPAAFADLPPVATLPPHPSEEIAANRRGWIDEWQRALAR